MIQAREAAPFLFFGFFLELLAMIASRQPGAFFLIDCRFFLPRLCLPWPGQFRHRHNRIQWILCPQPGKGKKGKLGSAMTKRYRLCDWWLPPEIGVLFFRNTTVDPFRPASRPRFFRGPFFYWPTCTKGIWRRYKGSTKAIWRQYEGNTKEIRRERKRNMTEIWRRYQGNTEEILMQYYGYVKRIQR